MRDPRLNKLAEVLLNHSCRLKPGDNVLIEAFDLPEPTLVVELVEGAAKLGARPFVEWKSNAVLRALYRTGTPENIGLAGEFEKARMEKMQAYIGVRGAFNSNNFSDVSSEQMDLYSTYWWKPVHIETRIRRTKWVVLRYPTESMAQSAGMSSEAFEDFYFDVCTADYAAMAKAQEPLRKRMASTDKVRLTGAETDLQFSIKGIPAIPCNGEHNIPDGEVFTAPVKESIEGVIRFNTPSLYQGTTFEGVEFEFKKGKIVRATCSNEPEKLEKILNSDEGARYCGEFAVGCNNKVLKPMKDILFDEKIGGSIHLTPGNAYDEADNGNRSKVHWDLVFIQRPDYGGGEMYFDGELVRKDGRFVPADLQPLNAGLPG
jgi:aminopeptidase